MSVIKREVKFLGDIVNGEGVATNLAKVAAVRQWLMPCNTREVYSFLASYNCHFVKDFATEARPLH